MQKRPMLKGKSLQWCSIFREIPSVSYIANVAGNDVPLATCIPNIIEVGFRVLVSTRNIKADSSHLYVKKNYPFFNCCISLSLHLANISNSLQYLSRS